MLTYDEVLQFARALLAENSVLRKELQQKTDELQMAHNALHGAEDMLHKVIKERNGQ